MCAVHMSMCTYVFIVISKLPASSTLRAMKSLIKKKKEEEEEEEGVRQMSDVMAAG